ncbi:MAG: hypothetical protein LBI31_02570 [Zoogloeaceae bacterium]|jgi:TPR repeat protein|nr:hypothetical protein [Zoogloeaceae bacterium]
MFRMMHWCMVLFAACFSLLVQAQDSPAPDADPIEVLKRAAEEGNADAQIALGGKCIIRNGTEARKWFQKAAKRGNRNARDMLQTLNLKQRKK